MKKFYIPIFAAVFVLSSFLSQGQVTYNSIASNPSNWTLDDIRFWQGGIQPPNPCNNCIINIYSSVSMVQNGASSDPAHNCACTYLNDVVLDGTTHGAVTGGSLNLYGNTTLSINTYVQLFNINVTLGNDPATPEAIFVNDQVDLDPTSTVVLANSFTVVNANNDVGNTVVGPHNDFTHPDHSAGLYYVPGGLIGGYSFSMILNSLGYGTGAGGASFNMAGYTLNCTALPPNVCAPGIVYGPAATTSDATFGVIFQESTTLPVQLVQFLATKNDDGSVKVSWATSQEENSNYYDVERSTDQSTWSSIGTVKAKGFSSTTTNYFLTDKSPVNGTGYYRLKMVDLDGKFTYSRAIPITTDQTNSALVIYSNPFSDQIRLKINVSKPQNLLLTVTDVLGKTYIAQSYQAQSGDNYVNLQPSASSTGMYVLHIQGDTYNQTVKLEKQ